MHYDYSDSWAFIVGTYMKPRLRPGRDHVSICAVSRVSGIKVLKELSTLLSVSSLSTECTNRGNPT